MVMLICGVAVVNVLMALLSRKCREDVIQFWSRQLKEVSGHASIDLGMDLEATVLYVRADHDPCTQLSRGYISPHPCWPQQG
jgi:hypothetical protein